MAAITWPASLPVPLRDGFGEAPPDTTLRSSMDTGPQKVRRRYTAGPRIFRLQYRMTTTQVAILDAFYITTSRAGSILFNWTHPRTGANVEARMKAPTYGAFEQFGEVSVEIEVMP